MSDQQPDQPYLPSDITVIKNDLRVHIEDSTRVHEKLTSSDALLEQQLNLLADEILGAPSPGFDGEVVREGGMKQQLADLHHAEVNGGLNARPLSIETKLKPSERTAILVALIASFGSIAVALIG